MEMMESLSLGGTKSRSERKTEKNANRHESRSPGNIRRDSYVCFFPKTFSVMLHTQVSTLGLERESGVGGSCNSGRSRSSAHRMRKAGAAAPAGSAVRAGPISLTAAQEKASLDGGKRACGRPDAGRCP